MLPNHDPKQVLATLIEVVGDDKIKFTPMNEATASQPTGMNPEVMGSIERVTQEMWPGVPVVPTMVTGATDGLYLRNAGIPTFGVSGLFEDISDVRAHGRDERIGVNAFYEGHEFLYRLVKTLSSSSVSLKRDR